MRYKILIIVTIFSSLIVIFFTNKHGSSIISAFEFLKPYANGKN